LRAALALGRAVFAADRRAAEARRASTLDEAGRRWRAHGGLVAAWQGHLAAQLAVVAAIEGPCRA
jgi:hypothetical protein